MTTKAFFTTTGSVSLKALRALWRAFSAMMAAFVWALAECMKYSSAADDSDEDEAYGHESADYYSSAAEYHFKDGWGS